MKRIAALFIALFIIATAFVACTTPGTPNNDNNDNNNGDNNDNTGNDNGNTKTWTFDS